MPIVLIVDKLGSIKEVNIKTYVEEDLYKKAGFKKSEGFKLTTSWDVCIENKSYFISVYGKTIGRAGQENKYEFPPPIDNTLFFGNCILVNQLEGNGVISLSKIEWQQIYEKLYGGFEDIGSEDSEDELDENEEKLPLTKNGYLKDGFIVEDDSDIDSDSDSDYENKEVIIPKLPVSKKISEKKPKKKLTVFDKIEITNEPVIQNTFLDCSKELEEEEYV
jgi:hypothetical protein